MTKYRDFGMRHDYVNTTLDRRCWLNTHNSKWMNNAINAPIQGTAAHMTKYALATIHSMAKNMNLPFCVNLLVHDEIDCDVPKEYLKTYKTIVETAWNSAGNFTIPGIPVPVELFSGNSWAVKE